MSFIQPDLSVLEFNFAPGFLDSPEPDTMPTGATPDARNCILDSVEIQDQQRAIVRRRGGARLLNPSAMSAQATVDLFEYVREGANGELLTVCNGVLRRFDGVSAFNAITGGTGFTPGDPVRLLPFRNNAFLSDGVQNLRYNGTQAFPVGFAAPTSAPVLTAGIGTLTGTYEGYAVWYDSVMDHESSPPLNSDGSLALSAQVALAAQGRNWAKPSGAPAANVDNWRVYCRRTDTNERNYFRVAQVAIGTASVLETISDGGRIALGPAPNENDVPPAFALMEEFKGFRLGVKATSSDLYVSKQYDAESQHPANVFAIGGKGDAKPIRCVKKYGEECLIQKPRQTYRIVGDTLPFTFTPVQSSLGGVSQDAGLEVRGWFYQWDEIVGPYRTNLVNWHPLGDNRIATTITRVNRLSLDQIRAAHHAPLNLVVWTVPTLSSRKRTLLAYNYVLDRWLPPMTGLEYYALTQYTTTDGKIGFYAGDYWGRVYELFSGDVEGVPSGDTSAAIASATVGTLTCSAATFYTTGDGLAGMPAAVLSPAGLWQWVRIQSNTGTVLTLDTTNGPSLNPVPGSGGTWTVYVGAIQAYWKTPTVHFRLPMMRKIARWFGLSARMSSPSHHVTVTAYLDGALTADQTLSMAFPAAGLLWGTGMWGVDSWSAGIASMEKRRLNRSFTSVQFMFANYLPNQPWAITCWALGADRLRRRRVASA